MSTNPNNTTAAGESNPLHPTSDPFQTPLDTMSQKDGYQVNPLETAGLKADYDKRAYGEANPALLGTLEKDDDLANRPIDAVEEVPTTSIRKWWVRLTWLTTWWIPSFALSKCGGMKRPDVQMAWREKVTICALIFWLCAIILFYIIAFGRILCPDYDKAWNESQLSQHAGETDYYAAVRGVVYDFTKFYKGDHSDITNLQTSSDTMLELAGLDLTEYFPVPLTVGCDFLVSDTSLSLSTTANNTPTVTQAIHTSGPLQGDSSSKLHDINWYPDRFLKFIKRYYKGYYVYSKKDVEDEGQWRDWAIVNNKVYDLSDYVYTNTLYSSNTAYTFLDDTITSLFTSQSGKDITSDFNEAMAAMNETYRGAHQACLDNVFYVGRTDFRNTAKCQVQNYLLLAFSVLLVTTVLAKFIAALQLGTKRTPEQQDKFVICQVPCYTEGEEELRKTIDSLAGLEYDDKRKLLFIICDGMIVGSGNDRSTPRIVLDILGVDPKIDPEPLMFKSVAEGSKQLNYGKVYSGLYEFEGHVVPYIVVVKVGRPSERSRPGNRGKRDTQILLMRYLNRVHFDAPMFPLELEIYHQMKNVIGIDPAFYEYILMVDADTRVESDGLNRLVANCADDSRIIAICGETTLDNAEGSWWTMIQVYEYYISHHLSKAFESLFGSVTCLPGCFSMYRIRSSDKGRPLFISNRIIDDYSENRVDTLHKKNLLHLGEDRYLTTLVLKHFPAFRTKFIQDAKALTSAPDQFGVLLSQRRRWINSTVHNLAELVLMPELCGFCLFSMRFIVFIDLLGTVILPATAIYLIYLIVTVATRTAAIPYISIVMIAAVYGLQVIIFLLKRQWQYIGWLIIYILAYPIYSFFLPLYSFWHMDDFSWGNTRIVVGEKGNKKIVAGTDDEPYDDTMIPVKRFSEYQREVWQEEAAAPSIRSGMTGASGPFGNSYAIPPHSGPPSLYKAGSQYAGSVAGSDFGGQGLSSGDYYQNTDVVQQARSRQGSQFGTGRMSSIGFSGTPSMYGMPTMGSMYGLPGSSASMYGMPTPSMVNPTASMYGLPPMMMANPLSATHSPAGSDIGLSNRHSTMPLSQQNTGSNGNGSGGNNHSGSNIWAQADAGSPVISPSANAGARPLSTFSAINPSNPFAAASAPYALPINDAADPTDEELQSAVQSYLAHQASLMTVTKRSVREALASAFPNADLSSKKQTINKAIDATLSGGAQA
ncbi:chitin synthase 6 [Testicularia cyperi]|uniref:chitin synthase n=1 Tax=Testicularia cyperi TaxID=1882483 RepID=A0A317XZP7_9BASI|nr:chitin synthase 6 [Testicularia cyperi]